MFNLKIIDAAYYLPNNKVTSSQIENKSWWIITKWMIERLIWIEERYYRADDEYPSTLASEACEKLIQRNKESIDLIIFASTSRDVSEPATGNIVQHILWLECQAFDVSNACASFLTWLNIADSFIASWKYENILLCSWETPSIATNPKSTDKKDLITWSTLWDAWAAFLLWTSEDPNKWIKYQKFFNRWQNWEDICVKWGGARSPRNPEDTYFKSHLETSMKYFWEIWLQSFQQWLEVSWWDKKDIKIFFHQASKNILEALLKTTWFSTDKVITTFKNYWNTASSSIPLWFALEKEKWNIKEGDKVVFIAPAAWLAFWIMFIQL